METSYPIVMKHVAFHEGGYTDNPKDPGGATNFGIIQRVYDSWRRTRGKFARNVKLIEKGEVDAIYRERYWELIQGARLPAGVDYCVMDGAVNSGVMQSSKWLQRAINRQPSNREKIKDDGEIGPTTLDRADDFNPVVLIDAICDERLAFMKVIRHKKTNALLWTTFGPGWLNRIEGYKNKSTGKREGGVRQWAKQLAQQQVIIDGALRETPQAPVKVEKPVVPTYPKEESGTGPLALVIAIIGAIIYAIWKGVQ